MSPKTADELIIEKNGEPGYFAEAWIYPFGKSVVAGYINVFFSDDADDWEILYNIQMTGVRPLADVRRLVEAQQKALEIAAEFKKAVSSG
jgi:hypothetical protein